MYDSSQVRFFSVLGTFFIFWIPAHSLILSTETILRRKYYEKNQSRPCYLQPWLLPHSPAVLPRQLRKKLLIIIPPRLLPIQRQGVKLPKTAHPIPSASDSLQSMVPLTTAGSAFYRALQRKGSRKTRT